MGIKSDQAGTWYVNGLHWADRHVNESITVEWGQKKQGQRREQEVLGTESCSSVGVTVKVMGRVMVGNGQVKVSTRT